MSEDIHNNIIIPDELTIFLNTTIPGFQHIKYNPTMTIPDIKSKKVFFNPLVKLNKNVIDKVPENIRIKEFFDKGLFQSLVNANGGNNTNLEKATKYGYIDNNIKLTLNTILPVKSVIYINKKPYSIMDIDWKEGDWRVNIKPKPILNNNHRYSKNPYLYNIIIKDEIISGENQLNSLHNNLAYGPKYDGPIIPIPEKKEIIPLPEPTPAPIPALKETEEPKKKKEMLALPAPPPKEAEEPKKKELLALPAPEKKELLALPAPEKKELLALPAPEKKELLALPAPEKKELLALPAPEKKELLALPAPEKKELLALPAPPPIDKTNTIPSIPEDEITPIADEPTPQQMFKVSQNSNTKLKAFLKDNNYMYLISSLYKNLDVQSKNIIFQNYQKTTSINVKPNTIDISSAAYKETIDGLRVNYNSGGGDCFFIAVADAINNYNYYNQNSKITSDVYGFGERIFTQGYLRELVYNYLNEQTEEYIDNLFITSEVYKNDLNDKFKNQFTKLQNEGVITDDITDEKYVDIIKSIYNTIPNFLITYEDKKPIIVDDLLQPFKLVERSMLKKYIESSNYWANELAFFALNNKLNLNIIPLEMKFENTKSGINNITVPYGFFDNKYHNNWDRYLFLLYNNSHFELLTFKFKIKKYPKVLKSTAIVEKTVSIFDRYTMNTNNNNSSSMVSVPIYILFLIYGDRYNIYSKELKMNFSLLPFIFKSVDESFMKIINSTNPNDVNNVNKERFIQQFIHYFPNSKKLLVKEEPNNITNEEEGEEEQEEQEEEQEEDTNTDTDTENQITTGGESAKVPTKNELSYYVTINLELKRGTDITDKDISSSKCVRKKNAITKSFYKLIGKKYVTPPDYELLKQNDIEEQKEKEKKEKEQKEKEQKEKEKKENEQKEQKEKEQKEKEQKEKEQKEREQKGGKSAKIIKHITRNKSVKNVKK
jgi:hypothetical protein